MVETVIITGAGTGFGLLTAQTLITKGYKVYAGIREPEDRNSERAEGLRAFAKDHGGIVEVLDLDILKEDSCKAAVDAVVEKDGRIDIVFHNAGHLFTGITEAFTAEQIADSVNSNVLGAHRLNRAVLPVMRKQGEGTLIYNGSGSSHVARFMGPYVIGKKAFDALAEATSCELNPFGIETVIIMPGSFTEGTSHFTSHVDPEDKEVLAGYERLKADQDQYEPGLQQIMQGRDAPAQAVADEVARVLALPRGTRPFRTEVDFSDWGTGPAIAVAEVQTARLWKNMGLVRLLRPTINKDVAVVA